VTRLLLVRHAPTSATHRAAFATDEAIAEDALAAARALAAHLPVCDTVLSSPALRCRQTAHAAGLQPELESALAECDFGTWEGRSFAEVAASEPSLIDGWLRDPDVAPHGGESLSRFAERVGRWLGAILRGDAGTTVAFTHAGVIKTAIVRALASPIDAFWRISAAPLSITEMHAHEGAWTVVRVNWTAAA
jgi:broad specificity phosphatase PhoE